MTYVSLLLITAMHVHGSADILEKTQIGLKFKLATHLLIRTMTEEVRSNKFYSPPFHLVIDIDVALCDRN